MARSKNKDISLAVSSLDFSSDFFKAIAGGVQSRNGTMGDLRRVIADADLCGRIADLIVPSPGVIQANLLAENEYRVPVSYEMPRDKATLEAEFSKNCVSDLFYGNYEWQSHSSCAEIDQTPGERIMLVKYFGRNTTSEANIAEMDKLGYRPATHLEAYAFAKANPELQRQFWIVALGSSALRGGNRDVAVLAGDSYRRILGAGWFGDEWRSADRFLFVRK